MEKILRYGALICAFLVLAAAPVCAKVASKYEVVNIAAPQDIYINTISGINNSNTIYGSAYQRSTSTWGVYRYNIDTGKTDFTDQMAFVGDMNSSGAIVGYYTMRNGTYQYCVWNADSSITDLPHMQSSIDLSSSINNSGDVLGQSSGSILRRTSSFIWNPGSGVSTPPLPSSTDVCNITDFNNNGYYLGRHFSPGDSESGINAIWSGDGSYYEIKNPNKSQSQKCEFLNDKNQVAGTSYYGNNETHVFLWSAADGMLDLTPGVGNNYWCNALNNNGQLLLAGGSLIGGAYVGGDYIWDADDGLVSAQDLIGPGSAWQVVNCRGINDNGWIVSSAINQITVNGGDIVLRPITTPEPGSVVALIAGLVGLAGFASRRKPSK